MTSERRLVIDLTELLLQPQAEEPNAPRQQIQVEQEIQLQMIRNRCINNICPSAKNRKTYPEPVSEGIRKEPYGTGMG